MKLKTVLLKLRNKINEIDELILHLLSQRRKIAIKIAKKKIINDLPIKDKNREKELLQELYHIGEMYQLPKKYIQKIFHDIIEDSIMVQKIVKIKIKQKKSLSQKIFSYLGPEGSYSHIASIKYIKQYYKNYTLKKYRNFHDIFNSLENNESDYAIVPIENNSSGIINEVYKLLCTKKINIVGECYLPIQHCLLAKSNTTLKNIKNIYSHNQVFKQCQKFIKNFKHWNIVHTNSTAEAMKIISTSTQNDIAAIGDKCNVNFYKLNVILEKISDHAKNKTRFLILTQKKTTEPKIISNKITLILKTQKILLFEIVTLLYTQKITTIQLQSKLYIHDNIKEKIYLEIEERIEQKNIEKTLTILKNRNISIKILGCYPTYNIS